MPEISVIMGVYNQTDETALNKAIKSILSQTYSDFEFIIYNDGSNSMTSQILKRISQTDSRIILIESNINNGLAFSLNECLKVARGKYIARMDDDDISLPERFEKQLMYLKMHPDIGFVGTNAYLFDEDGIWGVRKMKEFPGLTDFYAFSPYIHPSIMYKRDVLMGGNEYSVSEEFLRCEDYEMFMRLHYGGICGANLQENLFVYRETVATYRKRTWSTRFNESRLRYNNFRKMNMLSVRGILSVLRPLVSGFIPNSLIRIRQRRIADSVEGDIGNIV